jgi:hypothetical protein
MNYGKYISPGRISNLPEESIEPLFYESFSESNRGVESQCTEQNRYYIYGIEQDINDVRNIGYLTSLAFALDMTPIDLIHKIMNLIKNNPDKFQSLLNGEIYKYFHSFK